MCAGTTPARVPPQGARAGPTTGCVGGHGREGSGDQRGRLTPVVAQKDIHAGREEGVARGAGGTAAARPDNRRLESEIEILKRACPANEHPDRHRHYQVARGTSAHRSARRAVRPSQGAPAVPHKGARCRCATLAGRGLGLCRPVRPRADLCSRMAVAVGFEPTVGVNAHTLSSSAPDDSAQSAWKDLRSETPAEGGARPRPNPSE